jgi:PleD family two-component response regulator
MGSNIFLQSEKGEGSEFSFMLQLHYECVDDIQPRESCNMELHKKSSFNAKILVVEDNEINRMLIGEMLLNSYYQF